MTATTTAPSAADLKAQAAAARATETKAGTKIVKAALATLPEHEFSTGSKGRRFSGNLVIDGVPVAVLIQVVDRNTVPKTK